MAEAISATFPSMPIRGAKSAATVAFHAASHHRVSDDKGVVRPVPSVNRSGPTRSAVVYLERPMDAVLAGLLGTAIGALAGILGSVIMAWQQNRAEKERLQAARFDEFVQSQRQALFDLSGLVANGAQAILWLCWAAEAKPSHRVRQEIEKYEERTYELWPKLATARAAAGVMTDEAFERIRQLVRELEVLDLDISRAAVRFDDDEKTARLRMLECRPTALQLSDQTVNEITAVLRELKALRSNASPDKSQL